jgi:hypothetical protein
MTASYYRSPVRHVWCVRPFRWDWEVTDGIGGRVLASGRCWTRSGATLDTDLALLDCEPALQLRLDRAAERLTREGLPVRVRLDEQNRACVTPLCVCSDADHRHVMQEFARITGSVRWEVR